ncbi:MAG: hypothetical protein IKW62_01475 [Clostridia bacterium]|nr:hypothetical protein [Clostridia bacterium]
MLKSVFRFVLLFVATAIISAAAASCAYIITKNSLSEKTGSATQDAPLATDSVYASTREEVPPAMKFDSYTVRLEDSSICVYAVCNQTEEFLYSTHVYRPNLSTEDISLLTAGVTLNTASELTGFMENYTS